MTFMSEDVDVKSGNVSVVGKLIVFENPLIYASRLPMVKLSLPPNKVVKSVGPIDVFPKRYEVAV